MYAEGAVMKRKDLISQNLSSSSGRKMLTETFIDEIEKVSRILSMKYRLDPAVSENMEDITQFFAIYLLEHEAVWKRAMSFESLSAFFKTELDYFIGEQTEKERRSGYRTLAGWTRIALKTDDRFKNRETANRKQRKVLIFGLSQWKDEKPLFKELFHDFSELRDTVNEHNAVMTFNPVTQTKPVFSRLVQEGSYDSDIDEQIRDCSEVLIKVSGAWCSVSQLISGFSEFWLGLDVSDGPIDDCVLKVADIDSLLLEEVAHQVKNFLGSCSFLEVSVLKVLFSDKKEGSMTFTDVARFHGLSTSTVSDRKKELLKKLSDTFVETDDTLITAVVNALADYLDSLQEDTDE